MASRSAARLSELGIVLPGPAAPVGSYVPYVLAGDLLFVSGQLPFVDGKLALSGRVGVDLTLAQGQEAARLCAINALAQMKAAAGDLDQVRRILRVVVYIAAAADFTQHPEVANGASDLLVAVLGDAGRHVRTAVSSPSLPRNAPVEVEVTAELAGT